MVSKEFPISGYMSLTPVFVYEKSKLSTALETMRSFGADSVPIIDEDFSVKGILCKRNVVRMLNVKGNFDELKEKQVREFFGECSIPIVLYQRMTVFEAYSIMKCLDVNGLPVTDSPWDKRIIAHLWLDDIKDIVEKNYQKISV